MSAEVVSMSLPERSCFECENGATTPGGSTYCLVFHELILSERLAAVDCDAYEPV